MILGSHVSLGGEKQFLGSVEETIFYHANAFMVYTGAPQNTLRKPISELRIEEAHQRMNEHHLSLDNVIVHAPYIVNLANPDPLKQEFAVAFLTEEVKRTAALGSHIMVFHPGAHMKEGAEAGIKRIADGLNKILYNTKDLNVYIALESMAGKGTEVGRSFEELRGIIDLVEMPNRMGICLDTCHMNDAGYDVKHHFDEVMHAFDQIVGLSFLKVFHINDSKNPLGAGKDRHENIGYGEIGFEALTYIVHHPKLNHIPKILETPYIESLTKSKVSYPPYRYEIESLRTRQFNCNLAKQVLTEYEGEKNAD